MHTVQYQLPNFDLLLDRQSRPNYKVNPHEPQLAREFIAFLDKLQNIISPFQRREIEGAQLPLCAAAYAIDADLQQLRVYLDYFVLLLLIEVMSDASNAQAGMFDLKFMVDLLNACAEGQPFDASERKDPLVELTASVVDMSNPDLRANVFRLFHPSIDVMQSKALFRICKQQRKKIMIVRIQPRSLWIHTSPIDATWMSQISLSQEILQTPAFKGLLESTIDLIALSNDLISYKKEKAQGEDKHNLVSVAMADPTVPVEPGDIQAALNFAGSKVSEAYSRFQSCKLDALARVAPDDVETRSEILRYVRVLLETIDGNIVWQIDPRTVRYHLFETPEERSSWLVSICVED
ncbi:hypothetical protein EV361DRAFT_1029373 [Lentinula raphanica]|nr:hypothetical protein F5880DRAFT_1504118 [Lentinula raphanica]KAJ3977960.1 hypothetical protein EV361DRAFT_1029373 [Lentinula raphanica]